MQTGVAGAAAALLSPRVAAGAPSGVGTTSAAGGGAPGAGDSAVLSRTLRTEQLVVTVYERVLASGLVAPAVASQLRVQLAQEHEHIATLERALRELGASRTSVSAAQRELHHHHIHIALARLRSQHECLKLLIDVESLAERAYFEATSRLTDPGLVRMSVEAMGCEAQHWTVLSAIQHPGKLYRSVPYPFVVGSK
jgi:hypothetical protein